MTRPNHIDLSAIDDEPVGFTFEVPFTLESLDREPLLAISPVRLTGTIRRIERGFAVDARHALEGQLECSRCLTAYPFASEEDFSLLLYPRPASLPDVRGLAPEDLDVSYYDGEDLDVEPIAEERVQMAIPMKPLCRDDCAGLCPRCGQDWNRGRCDCTADEGDPRWAALRTVRDAIRPEKAGPEKA
jgi:uncharacterized protein